MLEWLRWIQTAFLFLSFFYKLETTLCDVHESFPLHFLASVL